MYKTYNYRFPIIFCLLFFFYCISSGYVASDEGTSNKAVSVKILNSTTAQEVSKEKTSEGQVFFILETEWENIHPKQKVDKEKAEGKTDRTMGVAELAGKKKTKTEYIEVDVAYMIEKIFDHAYLVAEGLAYPIHVISESVPEGVPLQERFIIAKHGEKRKAVFVYSIPENAENIGFQFFDYQFGNILLPIQGNLNAALGSGAPPGKVLGQIKTNIVEIAAHSIDYQNTYAEKVAPEDWQFAVVQISGKSLSGKNIKDIVQIEPTKYTWTQTEGGYLYYASAGSTTKEGMIRFTPEIFQHQELAFLIPLSSQAAQLGIRLRNDVYLINMNGAVSKKMPNAIATHRDGDVMEIMLFGMRKDDGSVILDLGIQSLATSGLEIQRKAQFILVVDETRISLGDSLTDKLAHRPPSPFIIPAKTFVRFELAFETDFSPTSLYYRGYRSENYFKLD